MRLSDLTPNDQVLAENLKDPQFRAEWERTALARAIALKLVAYRADRDLSQRALAEQLGMKQPQVARLERGDVTPSIETLVRLSHRLGIEIALDFRPAGTKPKLISKRAQTSDMLASYNSSDTAVLFAAA